MKNRRVILSMSAILAAVTAAGMALHAQVSQPQFRWLAPGTDIVLPREMTFDNAAGRLGILNSDGPVATKGHPFFEPLGPNGRACVTCHQPAGAMSLPLDLIRERWSVTGGKDPLFAAIDGSDNPSLPQDRESSHSLLLNRGLFRVGLAWPPEKNPAPEFTIDIVRDPTGVNRDPAWGLNSARPTVSVFRRPRPVANLKYVLAPDNGLFNVKLGVLLEKDPVTGKPVSMNMMADARAATLAIQAEGAYHDHQQGKGPLRPDQLNPIVAFESQVYAAQIYDSGAKNLIEPGGPGALGPLNLFRETAGVLNSPAKPVFLSFDPWKTENEFRQSVARGNDIFLNRTFWVRDVAHINSIGLGNPAKRSCAVCHNAVMSGMDRAPGWVDLGTTNYPTWTEPKTWNEPGELPVFKLTCRTDVKPHPFLGRVIYTSDPGRALVTGKCADIGAITMGQFRGLAARAPYFVNGSAKNLMELVDYYDRRFDMRLTTQEKEDLVNFLKVL
jgi:cytochrome c peroxidase